ncbi:MAG: InlB B-repeat-containing protein [Clostridia bacterium]|nr:InlB B-repeat-containing protein [Clostridia bacterium]
MKKTLRLLLALVLTVAVLATGLIFANAATTVTNAGELKAAIENGGEIIIANDIDYAEKMAIAGKTITFTGTGKVTFTDNDGMVLTSGSNVTIDGPVFIQPNSARGQKRALVVWESFCTVESGGFVGFLHNQGNGSGEGGVLTINGGTFTQNAENAIETDGVSAVTNINGGTFVAAETDTELLEVNKGKLNIAGGNFTKGTADFVKLGTDSSVMLTVTGGTYNFDPAAYIDTEEYETVESAGKWTVGLIGELTTTTVTTFAELQAAVDANAPRIKIVGTINTTERLKFGEDKTIILTGDGEVIFDGDGDTGVHIYDNCNVIFDGPSFTVANTKSRLFVLWTEADPVAVTIKQGTFTGAIQVQENATLTVDGGTFYGKDDNTKSAQVIETTGGSNTNKHIIINGGTFNSTGAESAIRLVGGDLVVNGGTFNNSGTGNALYLKADSAEAITIKGATINNTSEEGAAIYINSGKAVTLKDVTINNGANTLKSGDGEVILETGKYDFDPSDYIASSEFVVTEESGIWTIAVKPREPETWEVFDYDSWEEAITNFENGDIINISADIVDDLELREITGKKLTFTGEGSVTFDGANATQTGLLVGAGAEVIFNGPSFATTQKDGADALVILESADAENKALVTVNAGTFTGQFSVKTNSGLTINGGTFNNAVENDNVHIIALYASSGDFEITGGTFNVVSRASGGDTAAVYFDNITNYNVNILNATFNITATGKNTYAAYINGGGNAENVFNVANCTVTNDGHGRAFHFRKNVTGTITFSDSSFSNNGPQPIFAFWAGDNEPAPTITLKNITAVHTGTDEWSAVVGQGDYANTVYVDGCNFTSVMPTIWLRDSGVSLVATGAPSTFTCLSTNAVRAADGCTFTDNGLVTVNNEAGKMAIKFDAQGATNPADAQTELSGKLAELPVVSKVGYIFNGWFDAATGGKKVTTDTVFTAPSTVYAQWTACDHKASTEQPNCKNGATCTVCGFEMPAGEHNNVWKFDANQHWQECDGCGTVAGAKANHTGGTATCSNKAVCSEANCAQAYGELDAANHESTEFTYVENAGGETHTKKNACCGAVVAADEAHAFGDDNVCDNCEFDKTPADDNTGDDTTNDNTDNNGGTTEDNKTEEKPAPNPGTQTGDFTNITLLFVLVAVSGLAMTTLTVRAKKRA